MITDVPTAEDFRQSGIGFLVLSWDAAYQLVFQSRCVGEWDHWGEEEAEFWNAVQRNLATSLALGQQGIELLLKAKIAEVSPFLLLDSHWCKVSYKDNISFAELRTIDSQDLVRAHDRVQSVKLPTDFTNRIDELRRRRNSIFHTVDKALKLTAKDVLFAILDASHHLIGPEQWINIRRQSYTSSPDFYAFSDEDFHGAMLAQEVATVIELFAPSDAFRFLGFNKKQRRYICYDCHRGSQELRVPLPCNFAVLKPNTPDSTNLYCLVCDDTTEVQRRPCDKKGCPGNVIHEDRICLTCWEQQDGE